MTTISMAFLMARADPRAGPARNCTGHPACAPLRGLTRHALACGQVFLIQSAAAVDSLCPWPGFAQLGGAVMLRIGIVTMLAGSHTGKSYPGRFLLSPVTASLYPW